MFSRPSAIQFGGGGPGGVVVVVVVVVERGHAGYSIIDTTSARRAFVWQAENRWTEETLQIPTESNPREDLTIVNKIAIQGTPQMAVD